MCSFTLSRCGLSTCIKAVIDWLIDDGCQHEHAGIIDDVYQQSVQSLTSAATEHCHRLPVASLRVFGMRRWLS